MNIGNFSNVPKDQFEEGKKLLMVILQPLKCGISLSLH